MDFRTAEQKAEFDSLFKSFMETFTKQFNQIRSIQIKINEQVKSIEVKNDEFFFRNYVAEFQSQNPMVCPQIRRQCLRMTMKKRN